MSQRSTLKFFRLRRADYLLKNTSVSCTFWEPDPSVYVSSKFARTFNGMCSKSYDEVAYVCVWQITA